MVVNFNYFFLFLQKENICRVLNCYKEFEFPYELKLHKIKVHLEKEAPFFCQLCKFPFAVKIKYQEHLKLHKNTKKNSKKFECNVCHKFFYYEQTLKNHKILLH